MACHERGLYGRVEWRWYTPVRTALKIPFNFRIYLGETHRYQALGDRAKALRDKGLSWVKIGKKLKISDKTAKKAAVRGTS